MSQRYSIIESGWKREIVLLQSAPCIWGKCSFCDYISDNCSDPQQCQIVNQEVLAQVRGHLGALEVINSGSCFELPETTINQLQNIVTEKGIKKLSFESHWLYHSKWPAWRNKFTNCEVIIKVGIETFDDHFRNNILKKGARFSSINDLEKVASYCDSVCLMVGIKGQTCKMIDRDIEILTKHFKYGCINIFIENSTPLQEDKELVAWFREKYGELPEYPNIDVLYHNEEFGVFG